MKIGSNYSPVYFKGIYNQTNNISDERSKTVSEPYMPLENIKTFYNNSIFPSLEISKIQNEINEKFILKSNGDWKQDSITLKNDNIKTFADDIFEIIQKYSLNTPNKIIEAFEKTANMSEQEIKNYSDKFSLWAYRYASKKKMQVKQEFLQDFLTSINRIKSVGTGNSPLSMEDLKSMINTKAERINKRHDNNTLNNRVKEKIKYSSDEILPDEKIILNEEEMQELRKLARTDENLSYEELCQKAVNKYVGGDYSILKASENVQKAILNTLPRYNSTKWEHCINSDFEKPPVVRWLSIYENPDEFVKKFNEGEIYKYNRIQSCSKEEKFCENEFKDSTPEMIVKFVIHPKSETSKARDLGERKYGDREVLYPANQEFVILDKELVAYNDQNNSFYRWVIHMQEK